MTFKDRRDAGVHLAKALEKFKDQPGVVYALPRGGVVLGAEVSRHLNMQLDLLIPRKIGHPLDPEYAIGALAESGDVVCNEEEVERVDPQWFDRAVEAERREALRRRQHYVGKHDSPSVEGKIAILVDDGIATGLTMRAAILDVRDRNAEQIVVAIPVIPTDTAEVLASEVDEIIALSIPERYLGAVGAYYENFTQISDDEVIQLMRQVQAL